MSVAVLAAALLACAPAPAAGIGASTQVVTVDATTTRTTHATLRLWQRSGGCWRVTAGPWPARVGRNGLSASHREGDGTTPLGTYRFGATVYGVAADPGVRLRYHRLRCGDWWDEDSSSPTYNTFRHVRCGARPPFGGGSEALWQATSAYRWFAVVGYNAQPVVPGRGSAIFLHVDVGRATNGCVSLPAPALARLLRLLDPRAAPRIAVRA